MGLPPQIARQIREVTAPGRLQVAQPQIKLATYFLLFLGAVPLLIYPGLVIANVMSLASRRTGDEPALLLQLVVYSFLLGSLVYPAIYFFCAVLAIAKAKKNESKAALCYAIGPLGYLLLLAGLLKTWFTYF